MPQCLFCGCRLSACVCVCMCAQAGSQHDLHVVHRLCAMWLSLSHDGTVNELMRQAFAAIPSHKLVTLVYQVSHTCLSHLLTYCALPHVQDSVTACKHYAGLAVL